MQNLKTFLTPLVGSQPQESPSESARDQLASERTAIMFGCYRRGEANDPDVYTASVAAVLAEYPAEVIHYVTDPRTGLPSKCDFLPTVKEVRDACENEMKPARDAMAREVRMRRLIADRGEDELDRSNRPSYEQIREKFAAVGIHIGGKRAAPSEPVEKAMERLGVTKEQWDAIPNAKATA